MHRDDLKLIQRSEEELTNEIRILKTVSNDKNWNLDYKYKS
jgi:hypothetical protein